jgi:adenosine/AMP kinase
MDVQLSIVALTWQDGANIVVGQTHFIKTAEDIAEIMAAVPGAKYGLAFSEASGPCLIRTEGNDASLVADAVRCAQAVAAGHTFYLILKNVFPVSVLNTLKACPEVCRIFCATGNPLQVIVAGTGQGRGIAGVIDGASPKGVETDSDRADRRAMLRKFGYKF